jgi:hypothetical protein
MQYEALIHVVVEVSDPDLLKQAALAAHTATHHHIDDFWAAHVTASPEQGLESVLAGPPMADGLKATVEQHDGLHFVGFHVSHPDI